MCDTRCRTLTDTKFDRTSPKIYILSNSVWAFSLSLADML